MIGILLANRSVVPCFMKCVVHVLNLKELFDTVNSTIKSVLMQYIATHDDIDKCQFGFKKGHSTIQGRIQRGGGCQGAMAPPPKPLDYYVT